MNPPHRLIATLLGMAAFMLVILGAASPAQAHPLGNFTVNHYHGLLLRPDGIEDNAVIDEAEIPTLQDRPSVDADADGTVTDQERTAYAAATCGQVAAGLRTEVAGRPVGWRVATASFAYRPGAVNLDTARLECRLRAAADLRRPATLRLTDTYRADRIGWHEITASGEGVTLTDPPVPATSVSDELRSYPNDLLASPLDERSVALRTAPGGGPAAVGARTAISMAGPFTRAVAALTDRFNAVVGARRLTPLVGLLGIGLALVLGAAHAALPGHGKTVMAAYIAGRRGSIADAVTVGATVTMTHTAGVLLLGLVLTLVAGLAGELLLGWLGVASGLLIAGIGAALLYSAARTLLRRRPATAPHDHHGHHDHHHADHDHADHADHDHAHRDHAHHADHAHPGHGAHGHGQPRTARRGLVGMGIAGGLVPSPSALVVLLGAIALGRTWFGVLLVVAYGAGMAATLTAAGLLLVHLRTRLDGALTQRVGRWSSRLMGATPVLTAALVLIVGLTLAIRGAIPLLGHAV